MVLGRLCRPTEGYVLIVAEKPKAARRIAEALGGRRATKCNVGGVPYWVFTRDDTVYVVGASVGHLFSLTTSLQGFPVFSYWWAPIWVAERGSYYAKKYYEVLKKLAEHASYYVNACDYDIEGSVIGFLIIKFLGDLRRAYRVKFSSLTESEIRRAFSHLMPLDMHMVEAGLARHELDWLWGVNVSRALMEALKRVTGRRLVLSAGRVQSPTLVEVVKAEEERNLHVPMPYFEVRALVRISGRTEWLVLGKEISTLGRARSIASKLREKGYLVVERVLKERVIVERPPPFNLSDLQAEAARLYGLPPLKTQEIAERLYLEALISYPRTNSQKLPPTLDLREIVEGLARVGEYRPLVRKLMEETGGILRPRQGEKDDPAHPAIHPTGNVPTRPLRKREKLVYDLIVRRFLASLSTAAVIERTTVILGVPELGVKASLQGLRVVKLGWWFYYSYSKLSAREVPKLLRGERVPIEEVKVVVRFTRPRPRYTKMSLVKWMESVGIGTEATRARIVETLFERGYLRTSKTGIEVTDLGFAVASILEKHFSKLTSVELTRYFERKLQDIMMGRETRERVVTEAKEFLSKLLEEFKSKYLEKVGYELALSLGLVPPPTNRCVICRREAVDGVFCELHFKAYEKLRECYAEWAKRMGSTSFNEYLRGLVSRKSTGRWVREVAEYLLAQRKA